MIDLGNDATRRSHVYPVRLLITATMIVVVINIYPSLVAMEYCEFDRFSYPIASLFSAGIFVAVYGWLASRNGGTSLWTWLAPVLLLTIGFARTIMIANWGYGSQKEPFGFWFLLTLAEKGLFQLGFLIAGFSLLRLALEGRKPVICFPKLTLFRVGTLVTIFASILAIEKAIGAERHFVSYGSGILMAAALFGNTFPLWDQECIESFLFLCIAFPTRNSIRSNVTKLMLIAIGVFGGAVLFELRIQWLWAMDERTDAMVYRSQYVSRILVAMGLSLVEVTAMAIALWVIYCAGYRWRVEHVNPKKISADSSFSLDPTGHVAKTFIDEKL